MQDALCHRAQRAAVMLYQPVPGEAAALCSIKAMQWCAEVGFGTGTWWMNSADLSLTRP